jgi:hypothetical protein
MSKYTPRTRDFWLAVSKADAARSLNIPRTIIERAIREGVLDCQLVPYGPRRPRISREALIAWRSTWPHLEDETK